MRVLFIPLIWLGLIGPQIPGAEPPKELNQLLSAREYRDYKKKTKYKDRMDQYRKALERYTGTIMRQFKAKQYDRGIETLADIEAVIAHARQEDGPVNPKDYRSKQVKKLEIRLRKLVEALDDLKRTAPIDHWEEFEVTIDELNEFRDQVLSHIFGSAISSEVSAPSDAQRAEAARVGSAWISGAPATAQRRRRGGGITGDQFTDEEYEKVQDAQELKKRVEVFLQIAESRLDEIDRRRSNREWDEDEPNPLEFFTPAQLMRAYVRSVEGVMTNIDDKARYRLASEKDIRKSLEKLNEKIIEFIPRLQPIREMAIERKDEELFLQYREAKKKSDAARKGSQMGLGAPVN